MNNIFTYIIAFAWLITGHIYAQVDQVSVGPSYSQQAYYTISTGDVFTLDNDAWDIAFSADGDIDAGIFINESASSTGAPLALFVAETTDWSETIIDLSVFADSLQLYNAEFNWTEGAFNRLKDEENGLDFGWGLYNPTTHVIEGNRIFVIRKRNGSFIKFQVVSYGAEGYTIQYANLDGSDEVTKTFAKDLAGDGSLFYYSINSDEIVSVPTDYDLIFQRYTTPLDAGGGVILEYMVMGVLTGPGAEVSVASGINPYEVEEADHAGNYTNFPAEIGHEWKYFDFSSGWIIDPEIAYFVKTKNGAKYKLIFIDFEGSTTGITSIEKEQLTTSTKSTFDTQFDLTISPNPTSDAVQFNFVGDDMADLILYNSTGQTVLSRKIRSSERIELAQLVGSGTYYALVRQNSLTVVKKIIVIQ